jgi:hypothetical protein
MHKLDVDKIIARSRDHDRHTFNPEREIKHKGAEPLTMDRKIKEIEK